MVSRHLPISTFTHHNFSTRLLPIRHLPIGTFTHHRAQLKNRLLPITLRHLPISLFSITNVEANKGKLNPRVKPQQKNILPVWTFVSSPHHVWKDSSLFRGARGMATPGLSFRTWIWGKTSYENISGEPSWDRDPGDHKLHSLKRPKFS